MTRVRVLWGAVVRGLALLALVGQVLLGMAVPAAATGAISPFPICSAHAHPDSAPASPDHPAGTDCALCPSCLLALHAAVIPAPPQVVASRVRLCSMEPPGPRTSPVTPARWTRIYPRGPPARA